MRILVVNAGSSSLKLRVLDDDDRVVGSEDLPAPEGHTDDAGVRGAIEGFGGVDAVGHRIVHGGREFLEPVRLDAEVGTLTPGKRADLTVVSLAGSPYHPVEDPAAAVVFGGSPERVLETIVEGETRYRTGDNEWREVRSTASAARGRMLAPRQ